MKSENWAPEADRYLKAGERNLHAFLHSSRAAKVGDWKSTLKNKERRWHPLEAAAAKCGGLRGTILEVGAGDGWCSAAILRLYPEVTSAYIVEIDEAAVNSLIPATLRSFEVEDRDVTLVLGSFNAIPYANYFDFVIAMGSLHHSENLFVTLRSIWHALKPGGRLLSQEPAMADGTSNGFYAARNAQITKFTEGIDIRNDERSDIFYRRCEYMTALYHAGFDVEVEDLPPSHPAPQPAAPSSAPAPAAAASGLNQFLTRAQALFTADPARAEKVSVPTPASLPSPVPGTPANVFLIGTKPLEPSAALPTTAWETL